MLPEYNYKLRGVYCRPDSLENTFPVVERIEVEAPCLIKVDNWGRCGTWRRVDVWWQDDIEMECYSKSV